MSLEEKTNNNILEVYNLEVLFPIFKGIFKRKVNEVRAVDSISLNIEKGKILGVVGESGSGKTTFGKAIIKILEISAPGVEIKGEINLLEENSKVNIAQFNNKQFKPFRKKIQMVFQDPYSSLNPRMIIKDIIKEPMDIHFKDMSEEEKISKVEYLIEKVGLRKDQIYRYPHEFSGGQRQRVVIARALSTNPEIIIADEPVSALDVSIQAQVINLIKEIQKEFNLTIIFIAHDLSVVEHISDNIAVMYLGDLVEYGTSDQISFSPKHPYTRSLISSVPIADPKNKNLKKVKLEGEIPSPLAKPSGCPFRVRCPIARKECAEAKPTFETDGTHRWACPYEGDWDKKFKD